jgi:hypothetical protein
MLKTTKRMTITLAIGLMVAIAALTAAPQSKSASPDIPQLHGEEALS